MNICIAGKNTIAVKCLQYAMTKIDREKLSVVVNDRDPFKNDWISSLGLFAQRKDIEIVNLEDLYPLKELIFFSIEFDKILEPTNFSTSNLFNIHFSLLPEYKGVYTSILPILHGKKYSGVTIHQIDHGIDTGAIIDQHKIAINKNTTSRDLYFKYMEVGFELFKNNFENILNGTFDSSPQGSENSSYYYRSDIDISALEVPVDKTACQVQKFVNAFRFREYQMPIFDGQKISKAEILGTCSAESPNSIINKSKERYVVTTIDYDIALYVDYYDVFIDSIKRNDKAGIEKYISYIEDLNETNINGSTPLMVACKYGSLLAVKLLMEQEVDLHLSDQESNTALIHAVKNMKDNRSREIVRLLISHGADVLHQNNEGKSAKDFLPHSPHRKELIKI